MEKKKRKLSSENSQAENTCLLQYEEDLKTKDEEIARLNECITKLKSQTYVGRILQYEEDLRKKDEEIARLNECVTELKHTINHDPLSSSHHSFAGPASVLQSNTELHRMSYCDSVNYGPSFDNHHLMPGPSSGFQNSTGLLEMPYCVQKAELRNKSKKDEGKTKQWQLSDKKDDNHKCDGSSLEENSNDIVPKIVPALQAQEFEDVKFNINLLPEIIIIKIFSYLGQNTLGKIARVCRRWNALTRSSVLWKIVDVNFRYNYYKSQNHAAIDLITNRVSSCASHIKLRFLCREDWSLRLHFEYLSANIHERCPNIQMLLLHDAKLSNSLEAVIDLCAHFLKNMTVLVFKCSKFGDKPTKESYNGISKVKILHIICCSNFKKPPFSKMPHLKVLRVTWTERATDINSWFKGHILFLNGLEILDLGSTVISAEAFLTILKQGFHLTELYLCHSLITDNDLILNASVNVFSHLKIICLHQAYIKITFNGILPLIQSCHSLQEVYVNDCISGSDSDVVRSLLNEVPVEVIKVKYGCNHPKERDYLYK